MRTIRLLSLAVFAVLSVAGASAAQDKSPTLLNALEVRQLIARGEPGDHARLAAHFTALAERSQAEARRHTSMSTAFVGNPSRNLGTGLSAHCKRIAALNTESAAAARELAKHHGALAGGAASKPPATTGRSDQNLTAPDPTAQELIALAAKANTPSDHRLLEEYFQTLAKTYTGEAADHTATAATYRGLPRNPGTAAAMAAHCDRLARLSRDLAAEATKAAGEHKAAGSSAK
jgi:hypothetical protein